MSATVLTLHSSVAILYIDFEIAEPIRFLCLSTQVSEDLDVI